MADTKTSALPAVASVTAGQEFPVNDGGTSKKATAAQIKTYTGGGDVVGPASATDNAVARFDGAGGKTLQNSDLVIGDTAANIVPVTATATNTLSIEGLDSWKALVSRGTDTGYLLVARAGLETRYVRIGPSDGGAQKIRASGDSLTFVTDDGGSPTTGLTISAQNGLTPGGRLRGVKGSDVASANDITLGSGNAFDITGTTQVNTIITTNWTNGSVVVLQFDGSVTVAHNTAGAGGVILLAGAVNFSATAGDTLTLMLHEGSWREIARTVI